MHFALFMQDKKVLQNVLVSLQILNSINFIDDCPFLISIMLINNPLVSLWKPIFEIQYAN